MMAIRSYWICGRCVITRVDVAAAHALVVRILMAVGAPAEFAGQQADVLIDGELRGHPSHGLLRLRNIVSRIEAGLLDPGSGGEPVWLRPSFLRVDGGNGLGPVVANRALALASERARETGVTVVALHRTSHLGMLASYVDRLAVGGQCAIATCTTEALVHPWGGRKAMLGTNPLAIGVPAHPRPLVLDMSTGLVSMGKVFDHARRGEPIPLGWALDELGEPTTDAVAATPPKGALAPFGGAKGYALGLALGVLVSALTRTALGPDVTGTLDAEFPTTKGDLFVVIDSPLGIDADTVDGYLRAVRESPPADPDRPVTIPGDSAGDRRDRALRDGLDLSQRTRDELSGLAGRLLGDPEWR